VNLFKFSGADLKRLASALSTRAGIRGASAGRYPIRFSLLYNRSILALSFSAVIPHHEGAAYISRAIVVALVTECRASSGRLWALSTRRANSEREQTETRFSTRAEASISSLMVTPRMLSLSTLVMPGVVIISYFVFSVFSLKLLWLSSVAMVDLAEEPTSRYESSANFAMYM